MRLLIINTSLDKDNENYANPISDRLGMGDIMHHSDVNIGVIDNYDSIIISGCPSVDTEAVEKELPFFFLAEKDR